MKHFVLSDTVTFGTEMQGCISECLNSGEIHAFPYKGKPHKLQK
jgi:hypothetical protein